MELMKLCYVPFFRDGVCFNFTPRSFDECCEEIKGLCETYPDDLRETEFYVDTESGEPVCNVSGILRNYTVKDAYRDLEPKIAELCRQCFPPETEEETGENP